MNAASRIARAAHAAWAAESDGDKLDFCLAAAREAAGRGEIARAEITWAAKAALAAWSSDPLPAADTAPDTIGDYRRAECARLEAREAEERKSAHYQSAERERAEAKAASDVADALRKLRIAELVAEFGEKAVWVRPPIAAGDPRLGGENEYGQIRWEYYYGFPGELTRWASEALADWPSVRDAARDLRVVEEELASHASWRALADRVPAVRVPPDWKNQSGYQDFRPRPRTTAPTTPRRPASAPVTPAPAVRINDPWGSLDALGLR